MRLNGWTWLVSGLILTIMSGYIYLAIPKNGKPNTAMALFFFIGIVFLVIGITQLFFKRKDDKSVLDSISLQPPEQKIVTMPTMEAKQNKVEDAINKMLEQETQKLQSQVKPNVQTPIQKPLTHQATTHDANKTQHTNSFSHLHQYKGPVHTPSTGIHTQHPVSQHVQQAAHHPVQNTIEHSIKCRKCGNANSGHSNYCHQCGNRLK